MPPGCSCLVAAGLLSVIAVAGASAQTRYEQQFGVPVPVSIDDLISNPSSYSGRAVKTTGPLEMGKTARSWYLRSTFGQLVRISPAGETAERWEQEALTFMGGQIEVTGVFNFGSTMAGAADGSGASNGIQFWKYVGPPDEKAAAAVKSDSISLEDLAGKAGQLDGKNVRVIGKYRGRNLFGDLPARSVKDTDDWVIKDDVYAVWITGKKPKGSGWELDLSLKRDTNKWIEVVGRPETIGGVTYIRALQVALSAPPRVAAEVAAPTPPPPRPKVPPVVVFSLPLDGERDVPSTGIFKVQFSKDMNEDSFRGRVIFRYAGPRLPGDREFVGVKLGYEGGRRALVIDPGDVLRPGRVVEIRLLPGIVDLDGLELTARPGKDTATAQTSDILRFQVVASTALLPPS
jgi:hypothetical protein